MGNGESSVLPPGPLTAAEARALAFEIRLRDGRRVLVRPVIPEDARRLQEDLTRMSWQSRLFRFHRRLSRLSREQLHYLAAVDQRTHAAWGALSLDEPGMPGVGVARYVVEQDDARTARAVITVIDDYQRVGLGMALLEMLRVTAHENGVTRLIGHVLPENTAGRRLVAGAGGTETGRTASGLLTTEICNDDSRPVLSSNMYRRAGTAARGEGGVPPVDGDGR
jgi:RimJ/RimL family protein N-acetyltransferase